MKLTRLQVTNFTAFTSETTLELSPGVNVLVGENGTGKTHLLKLAYVMARIGNEFARRQADDAATPIPSVGPSSPQMAKWIEIELMETFQPESLGALRASSDRCDVRAEWERGTAIDVVISGDEIGANLHRDHPQVPPALFLPSREMLSIYPGFVAAWLNRESAFDRTYFNLCQALGLRPLRAAAVPEHIEALATKLEAALGGKVVLRNDRFYLDYDGVQRQANLVGEGDRKVAMLVHLLRNGSLIEDTLLAWDEPESSLNPKRALLMSDVAFALASAGVQVLLSTHDYALCSELSLKAEESGAAPIAFFGLRAELGRGVSVERSPTFLGLKGNPILDAYGDLHDREELAMATSGNAL
jgi:ABC-type lipoprotein export system ATPase subunit